MHPITSSRGRVGTYLGACVPVTGVLSVILVARGDITFVEGLLVGLGLGGAFALFGLPIWYICRASPLRGTNIFRSIITHVLAAALFATLLHVAARVVALFVEGLLGEGTPPGPGELGLMDRLSPQYSVLFFLGLLAYFLFASVYYLMLAVEASKDAERHQERLRTLAGEAELRALKAQLNPHFLFNSLNSISALTTADPATAREMCVRLADFFRRSLGLGDRTSVTLDEELTLLAQYLAVEKIRLGDRLRVEEQIDPAARSTPIPPLLLQPLVENAILHGIGTLTEGGLLSIRAELLQERLRVEISNPYDPHAPQRPGSGRGLENVRRRVAAHSGGAGWVQADSSGDAYRIVLSLPHLGEPSDER